jgi:hypothetical protein
VKEGREKVRDGEAGEGERRKEREQRKGGEIRSERRGRMKFNRGEGRSIKKGEIFIESFKMNDEGVNQVISLPTHSIPLLTIQFERTL